MKQSASVVAFSGHMLDAPTRREPRFPPSRVEAVLAALRARLASRPDPLIGVCSAADGGDQLFMKAVLERRGTLLVQLPFPLEAFKQTSVRPDWRERLDELLAADGVELHDPLLPALPATQAEQNDAFARVNTVIINTAVDLAARHGDPDPWFLAVYRQSAIDKEGGTGHAFGDWTQAGRRLEIVDPQRC